MPIEPPPIDDRTYQDLLDQALARIPVHTPEWTNFGKSDPGVTLIEVFAFLTDSLLYRTKLIPERNRLKMLSLLGVPLQPASSAVGLVTLDNARGAPATLYLPPDLEVRAGPVPFRTERGLDVLPVEGRVFFKRTVEPDKAVENRYALLYASFKHDEPKTELEFYETTPLPPFGSGSLDLDSTVDHSIWIALLLREADRPRKASELESARARAREQLVGRTLNIGVVPSYADEGLSLSPGKSPGSETTTWDVDVPLVEDQGLPDKPEDRYAKYRTIATLPAPTQPAIFEVELPAEASELALWPDLGALEQGVRNFPPALDDETQSDRIVTWIRVRPSTSSGAKILWAGINVVGVSQRARVLQELLPTGTGEPDQEATLAQAPVLRDSVRLRVDGEEWAQVPDLLAAGPEVQVPDPRLPPGAPRPPKRPAEVFTLDPESGRIRFGDGLRGARPARGAQILVDYDRGVGRVGNVGPGTIKSGPSLPPGIKVSNPVATWGGVDAETSKEGEKQVARWLQHRDRLVTAADFETITLRTPGVSVGRVDVLPTYHPEHSAETADEGPLSVPGVVTLMVLPRHDPHSPEYPQARTPFLRAIADYLQPRRLLTTEVLLRGPTYKKVHVSVGVQLVAAGAGGPEVIAAIERALRRFFSPLPEPGFELDERAALLTPSEASRRRGWPLRQAVYPQEIAAVVSRVDGVAWVREVLVSDGGESETAPIPMTKLELPRLTRLAVTVGRARPIVELLGTSSTPPSSDTKLVPVPIVPEEC